MSSNLSPSVPVKSLYYMQYRTLPAATWTHESDSLPRLYVKVDPVENRDLRPRRVTEYDI